MQGSVADAGDTVVKKNTNVSALVDLDSGEGARREESRSEEKKEGWQGAGWGGVLGKLPLSVER